ncbi:hypothetical protein PIB30_111128, partial [Stylosanthes scabra]|nr:hypothetical protein [Stylosanthes scabra]
SEWRRGLKRKASWDFPAPSSSYAKRQGYQSESLGGQENTSREAYNCKKNRVHKVTKACPAKASRE